MDANTEIRGDHGTPLTFSDLQVGDRVEVHAVRQPDSSWLATRIEVEDDEDDDDIEVEGRIQALGVNDTVVVNNILFRVDSTTEIRGPHGTDLTFSDLMVGDLVEVRADLQPDSTWLATRIEVEEEDEDFRIQGRVQNVTPPHITVDSLTFLVNGATRIRGPHGLELVLTDLLVGDLVEVRAAIRPDSTLLAIRIELEDEHPDTTIVGRITDIGVHQLSVDSLTFLVNAATRIRDMDENPLTLADLQVGDSVEVRAALRPDSSWLATRITLRQSVNGLNDDVRTTARTFELKQNYPNPFNPTTTIPLVLRERRWRKVRLDIYNALGQQIRTLFNGLLDAGRYEFQWDGRDDQGRRVPSGVYFYQIRIDNRVGDSKAMILTR